MTDKPRFCTLLRSLRTARAMTAPQLAALAGIKANTIYNAESSQYQTLSTKRLEVVIKALDLDKPGADLLRLEHGKLELSPFQLAQRERWQADRDRKARLRETRIANAQADEAQAKLEYLQGRHAAMTLALVELTGVVLGHTYGTDRSPCICAGARAEAGDYCEMCAALVVLDLPAPWSETSGDALLQLQLRLTDLASTASPQATERPQATPSEEVDFG